MKHHSLIHLFNSELVDFVKKNEDDTYTPVEWPKDATHELIPTSWNSRNKYKPNKKGVVVMPDGYALAVCAVPLQRKFKLKGVFLTATQRLPEGAGAVPVYDVNASEGGKRAVLEQLTELMGADLKLSTIQKSNGVQCDGLYRSLANAYFQFVRK